MTLQDVYDRLYMIYERLTSDDLDKEVRDDALLLVIGLMQEVHDEL